jgi:hypothetical protein
MRTSGKSTMGPRDPRTHPRVAGPGSATFATCGRRGRGMVTSCTRPPANSVRGGQTSLDRVKKHFGESLQGASLADLHCLQTFQWRGAAKRVVIHPGRRDKKNTPRSTRSSSSQAPRQQLLELLQAISGATSLRCIHRLQQALCFHRCHRRFSYHGHVRRSMGFPQPPAVGYIPLTVTLTLTVVALDPYPFLIHPPP